MARRTMPPKALIYAGMVMAILALIPPALIARSRTTISENRRIHLVQDMDNQGRPKAQQASPLFADGRIARPVLEGTVARGEKRLDDHFDRGYSMTTDATGNPAVQWFTTYPPSLTIDEAFLKRGQERFNIYCSVCHGQAGYGDGIIHVRAQRLVEGGVNGTTWVQPKNIHEDAIRAQPPGQIFNSITHGIRTMAGYESQIPTIDRWAITAYVKALQRSQHAQPADVPADQQSLLETIRLNAGGATP